MPKLTDETLMLYADGLLGSHEAEHVEKVLAQDSDLRSRLQIFKLTGRELGDLMQDHVNSPMPQRLLDTLAKPSPEPFSLAAVYQRFVRFSADVVENLRSRGWGLDPAMAVAAVALVAGLGLGLLLRGHEATTVAGLEEFIRRDGKQLVAQGSLEQTLNNALSNGANIAPSSSNHGIGVTMTFQNEAGDYCRQYQITERADWNYTGVACRSDGNWVVTFQALTAPSQPAADGYIPASGGDRLAIDAAIGALVYDRPLTGGEEAAALRSGWKQ